MLPGVDFLALLFIFPVLATQFTSYGGHEVVLANSSVRLTSSQSDTIIKVLPGEPAKIWVNEDLLTLSELEQRLDEIRENWKEGGDPSVWLKVDVNVTHGEEAKITEMLVMKSFKVTKVGKFRTEGVATP